MAITETPRVGLPQWGAGTDPFGRAQMNGAFANAEERVAIFDQDTIANRPAAGTLGRFFWATDELLLYYDTGTVWHEVTENFYSKTESSTALPHPFLLAGM